MKYPTDFNRRDFLKLLSLGGAPLLRKPLRKLGSSQGQAKNILILVYDAWTSMNMGQFGYARDTMPQLAELSRKAIVYHKHHATGDYTTPGTASLLTGTLPWTHRALHVAGRVREELEGNNLFNLFDDYYTLAYSHNVLVNVLLEQMLTSGLDEYVPFHEMLLYSDWVEKVFHEDRDLSSVSAYYAFDRENPLRNSLVLGPLIEWLTKFSLESTIEQYAERFPLGLPRTTRNTHYILEDARDWLLRELPQQELPYLGYFHFLPPHDPYRTRAEFVGRFEDGWEAPEKPEHPFHGDIPKRRADVLRREYDEFMAYVDAEFGALYRGLEESGQLENTILMLTSDHGESFERGLVRHGTNTFHEPILRVPLMIFDPDRPEGGDVYTPSSAIDLLPTLARIAGKPAPQWAEGQVLAPYGAEDASRAVFAATSKEGKTGEALEQGTWAIVREGYKLVEYVGYEALGGEAGYELYDLNADPDELKNIYESQPARALELLQALRAEKDRAERALN